METEFKVTDDILASQGQRLGNYFIDLIIFYAVFFGVTIIAILIGDLIGTDKVLIFLESLENINGILDYLLTSLIFIILYTIFESITQRTIGKYITKTIVVLENGEKPSTDTIALRSLCRRIPFNHFSFLGTPSRGWHDTISKTYVVDKNKLLTKKQSEIDFKNLGKPVNEVVF